MSSSTSTSAPHPSITVFAGPNGSGKTTITNVLAAELQIGMLVNADVMAARAARSGGLSQAPYDLQMRAAIEAEELRKSMIRDRISFATETVMSDSERWILFFNEAREQGFFLRLIFISTSDPAINVARVAQRVAAGGHHVDPDKVIARYYKTHAFLPTVLSLVDDAFVFDNSDDEAGSVLVLTKAAPAPLRVMVPMAKLPAWARALL